MSNQDSESDPKKQWMQNLFDTQMPKTDAPQEPPRQSQSGEDPVLDETWTRTVFAKGKLKEGGSREKVEDPLAPSADSLPDTDVIVGTTVAEKYEVLCFVGKGGMSTIYKVKHKQLDTILALKLLDKTMWSDPTAVKRFKLEAQTVSRLTHPNLITYRDFGITGDGQPYLVMDYIQGSNLSQKIKESRGMFLPDVADIFRQLCEGLSVAHSLGIVHRDVKPGNIMFLTEDSNHVKLVDFGIAKIVTEDGAAGQHLTQTGDVFGSPLYMSPEQCMGKKLDSRSDIYSLGCVMYEAMTGRLAIMGNTILDTMNKHVSDMPLTPTEVRPDLIGADKASWLDVEELEYIVMRCLQKNPQDRYKSVDDIVEDLKKVQAQEKLQKEIPVSTVKKLRHTENFDRPSAKDTLQMVATITYMIVGIGIVGAAAYYFFFTPHNTNISASVKVEEKSKQPEGPNQNLLLDAGGDVNDAADSDNKAMRYFDKGNYKRAAEYFEISAQVYQEKGGHDFMLADTHANLGDCYAKLDQSDRAIANYKKALNIYDQHPANLTVKQRKRVLLAYAAVLRQDKQEPLARAMEDKANALKEEQSTQ